MNELTEDLTEDKRDNIVTKRPDGLDLTDLSVPTTIIIKGAIVTDE
jgi:hypothetical protein